MINNTFKDIFFDGSILALEKSSKKKKKAVWIFFLLYV